MRARLLIDSLLAREAVTATAPREVSGRQVLSTLVQRCTLCHASHSSGVPEFVDELREPGREPPATRSTLDDEMDHPG